MKVRCVICEKEISSPRKGADFVVCDDCKRQEPALRNEKPHQLRRRLKANGWVRALRNGTISYEGPLDYCPTCFAKMKEKANGK